MDSSLASCSLDAATLDELRVALRCSSCSQGVPLSIVFPGGRGDDFRRPFFTPKEDHKK